MYLRATPTSSWAMWARYGFHFARRASQEETIYAFRRNLALLGHDPRLIADDAQPADLYLVGGGEPVELRDVAERIGLSGDSETERIVSEQPRSRDIELGHALLLLGVDWDGAVLLSSVTADRIVDRCRARLRALGLKDSA